VRVANPLAADDAFLRTSLLPGLLRAVGHNLNNGVRSVALFEVGRVFALGDPVAESEHVAVVMAGSMAGFPGEDRAFDFFDAKGAVETLIEALGVPAWEPGPPPSRRLFHPARSASVVVAGELAGEVGEIAPRVAAGFDLVSRVAVVELDIEVLARHASSDVVYREAPRFPPVRRDLAFILDSGTPAASAGQAIAEAAGGLADSVVLFDVFTGPPIPEGKKSLAFSVDFRAPDRTLTDEEAEGAVRRIVERLARDFGAELRS
jgi:phenylalanyl-tRNA synthetase beta chain